jgi:hypothetical protein
MKVLTVVRGFRYWWWEGGIQYIRKWRELTVGRGVV